MEHYHDLRRKIKEGREIENPIYDLIKRFRPDFEDSENTIVIIDEIQESADIYNRIREFTRTLQSDFIVTGSYLGRILNKEFKYSAGVYQKTEEWYNIYCSIGGYPVVILKYLEGGSPEECQMELYKITRLFIHESKRYFRDILDDAVYDNMFVGVARILAKEKKGFAGKLPECSLLDFKAKSRCYFMDVGLAVYSREQRAK